MNEAMKEEFIAWCKTRDVNPQKLKGTGQFIGAEVQSAWMGWQAALSQQPAQPDVTLIDEGNMLAKGKYSDIVSDGGLDMRDREPVRIEFGKGLIGVHTVMMSERKAIALTNLGVGKVGVPTLHPNGTACESIIVEMDFGNAESCQVLIDELTSLFSVRPSYESLRAENAQLKEAIKAHEDAFTESLGDTLELIAERDKLQQLLMTALDTGRAAIAERDALKARNVELEPAFEKASKACSSALLALAHTSLDNPLYSDAYEEVNAMMPIFMELRKK